MGTTRKRRWLDEVQKVKGASAEEGDVPMPMHDSVRLDGMAVRIAGNGKIPSLLCTTLECHRTS